MTREAETLTKLVADRVGDGRELMTYRAFETRAVDPESDYRPSRSTIWKIRKGEPIKVSPELIRAVAAGLGLDLGRVQAAAALQYTGLVATSTLGGAVVHPSGAARGRRSGELLEEWDAEEGHNRSGTS